MKNTFFSINIISMVIVFVISYLQLSAQDYNFICPGINFQYTTPGATDIPVSNLFNYYAWSQIKETRIDSSVATVSETKHIYELHLAGLKK